MRSALPRLVLACAVLFAGRAAGASGPVTLANDQVEIGVDVPHGLILGFGRPGQANLLWVNPHPLSSRRLAGWINYGGEKLWWGPQIDWQAVTGRRFPPDEALDGAWEVTAQAADRVVMRSGVSPWVGVRAEREIALVPGEAGVVIRNRFIRERAGGQRLQLWTVCMLPRPRWCWLESRPLPGAAPFVNLRPNLAPGAAVQADPAQGIVRGAAAPATAYLIGTRGGWITAVYDDCLLVHEVTPFPDGDYAEQVSLQLFFGPAYIELETLGGLASPAVGESMTNVVHWRLLTRPAGLGEAELLAWLRRQLVPR